MRAAPALFVLLLASAAAGAGWHDYRLEIAPGFGVERMNSFQVCLAGREGLLIVCPMMSDPAFGPLVEYAVTEDFIITRNLGARRHEENPAIWQGDPTKEFFFLVARKDQQVAGPLTREEWERDDLPDLATLDWVVPRNPRFWTPLLGDLSALGFMAVYAGWPLLAALLIASFALVLVRRNRRGGSAA